MDNITTFNTSSKAAENIVENIKSYQYKQNINLQHNVHANNELDSYKNSVDWNNDLGSTMHRDSSSESQVDHFNDEHISWLSQVASESQSADEIILKNYKSDVSIKSEKKNKPKVKLKKKQNDQSGDKYKQDLSDVKVRLNYGCECRISCYRGLRPETVYKHRINISKLSKSEHDMYLMGVTMASICDPAETSRHKERRRLRASYVYQGRKVCLEAFLYLENVTHYQLKRIRKHVMLNGVVPRIHGNIGKKPYNSFNMDTYQNATNFVKNYIESNFGVKDCLHRTIIIQGETRKNIYDHYLENGKLAGSDLKLMGYSTFRQFIKEQFSNIKFTKLDKKDYAKPGSVNKVSDFNNIESSSLEQNLEPDIQAMPIVVVEDNIEFVLAQVPTHIFQSSNDQ